MYKHIVTGLDGSPRAMHVLRTAADLAARHGARLHLVHAVHLPLGIPADAFCLSGDELMERMLEVGTRELARLAEELHPTQTPVLWGQRVCRYGAPAQVVIDAAEELHADLVVVGSHGFDVVDRLLGTTAARIVNHARCSVLVVRGGSAA